MWRGSTGGSASGRSCGTSGGGGSGCCGSCYWLWIVGGVKWPGRQRRRTGHPQTSQGSNLSPQERQDDGGDERGVSLPDDQINDRQYRSISFLNAKQAARKLQEEFGDSLLTVPGFQVERGAITSVTMPRGILIPVRDTRGRILAFQVRRDEGGGGKYLWFSGGATSSGALAHVPLGVVPAHVLRVTEGP